MLLMTDGMSYIVNVSHSSFSAATSASARSQQQAYILRLRFQKHQQPHSYHCLPSKYTILIPGQCLYRPALFQKKDQGDAIIENGYNIATRGNATADKEWPTCVSCVMLSRSFDRTETTVPAACKKCFERYCWDGTTNTTTSAAYEPKLIKDND